MPSMTIPNQALTVQEILLRHTRNIPLQATAKIPEYSDEYTPEIKSLDLTDIQRMQEENEEIILKHKEALAEQEKAKRKKEMEEYYEQRKKEDNEQANKSIPPSGADQS